MIEEGLVLMGVGMGVVALFLTLMVCTVHGAAAIIRYVEVRGKAKTAPTEGGATK